MATDIKRFKYQTDKYDESGNPSSDNSGNDFVFYVEMDSSSVGAAKAGAEPVPAADINFTLRSFANKGDYGLHPRHVELARVIEGAGGSACLIQKGEISRKLVILTPTRFNALQVRNSAPGVAGTSIELDGVTFVVVRKVPERRNNAFNAAPQGRYKA